MLTFLVFASALFASYTINCGINYYRHTFAEEAGLEIKERSVDELIALCEKLTARVNTYSESIVRNKHGLCVLETDTGERAVKRCTQFRRNFRRWPVLSETERADCLTDSVIPAVDRNIFTIYN